MAVKQEKRRNLRLDTTLIHCFYKTDDETAERLYAFQLTVRNPSDSNNAISEADLVITYLTEDRIQMTTKVRADVANSSSFVHGENNLLNVPKFISAHDTISGWLHFFVSEVIILGNEITSHEIILCDTHGDTTSVEPIMVQEYFDEV